MSDVPQHQGRSIRTDVRIEAPVEDVWEAWADPDKIAGWFVDRAKTRAEDGAVVVWEWAPFRFALSQKVLAAKAPERLVLQAQPGALIEIVLERDGGATVLTLVNSGFLDGAEWEEPFQGVVSGWVLALALLKEYVEHHYGQTKRQFMHLLPAPTEPMRTKKWFAESPDLEALLAREGKELRTRTLAETGRELSFISSDGIVVELKAFAGGVMGPGPSMFGIRATTWGDNAALGDFERLCRAAVEHFATLKAEPDAA
jgi:uncharacterized protein YndB with AHSA1/START domain